MSQASLRNNVKSQLMEVLNEQDGTMKFDEIYDSMDTANESEIREALLELVDENRVVVNADWEYRSRRTSP